VRPLAIDLFSGLGGWTAGLTAAGWYVIRFDLEDMCTLLGEPHPEHSNLVIQDVRTLHGSQFRNAGLIVSSSPCTEYSYMAMPWQRAKAKAADIRADTSGEKLRKLNELFDAQFRIQREASEAAGHHIPLVAENVRGAGPWVGRSRANFGSYHLWGDVPALMPIARMYGPSEAVKRTGRTMCFPAGSSNPDAVRGRTGKLHWQDNPSDVRKVPGFRFDGSGRSFQTASVEGVKSPACKGGWFGDGSAVGHGRQHAHKSKARKAASARIAKIPLTLSTFIGRVYYPSRSIAPVTPASSPPTLTETEAA
jgi:C-5 cytosine-specific DNA methylase